MSIIAQIAIICAICLAGIGVAWLLPFPFPAGVISMILVIVLLFSGILKERHIKNVSAFLMANISFFFIPSFASAIEYLDILKENLIPFLLIGIGTCIPVYLVTAWTVQLMIRFRQKKKILRETSKGKGGVNHD